MTHSAQTHSRDPVRWGWPAILAIAIGLAVLVAGGIYQSVARDADKALSPSDRIAQVDGVREALRRRFGEEALEVNTSYRRAMQALARARRLVGADRTSLAEPHARSALVLIEHTERALERERFNRLEAKVIALQLQLADREHVSAESVARADTALRMALQAASENHWDDAREHLARAEAAYRVLLLGTGVH